MINQKRVGLGAMQTTATAIRCNYVAFAAGQFVQKRSFPVQYRHRRSLVVNY